MNVVDKLYTEWAWRTKSGTPDYKNPEDKAILDKLINELGGESLINEASPNYDDYIKKVLNVDTIPQAQGTYKVPNGSGDMKVADSDMKAYQALFPANVGDQTVGPGELALYWLYQHQKNSVPSQDNRGGSEPDLQIGSIKTEVKSYGKHTGKITLGKFGDQKRNLTMLTVIFGIQALSSVLRLEENKKVIRPTSFTAKELVEAFEFYFKLKNSPGLLEASNQFELIRSIKEKVDFVDRVLEKPEDARDGASRLIGRIAKEKFKVKPGDGNYIASMTPNGDIHFFHIVLSKLEQDLLDKVSISAGEVKVDFMSIFG